MDTSARNLKNLFTIYMLLDGETKRIRGGRDENSYIRCYDCACLRGVCRIDGLPTSIEMSGLVINKPPTVLDTKITNCFEHASYTR